MWWHESLWKVRLLWGGKSDGGRKCDVNLACSTHPDDCRWMYVVTMMQAIVAPIVLRRRMAEIVRFTCDGASLLPVSSKQFLVLFESSSAYWKPMRQGIAAFTSDDLVEKLEGLPDHVTCPPVYVQLSGRKRECWVWSVTNWAWMRVSSSVLAWEKISRETKKPCDVSDCNTVPFTVQI